MKCNGKEITLKEEIVLRDFLNQSGYDSSRIAVEVNLEIIPKESYNSLKLKDSDVVEIVSFMGGG